jgi:hypothetical protein
VLAELAEAEPVGEPERRDIVRRDRDDETLDAVFVLSPAHDAVDRFARVAAAAMGGEDGVAELDGLLDIGPEVVRVGPGMKPDVADHLARLLQDQGADRPRKIVGVRAKLSQGEAQDGGVVGQIDGDLGVEMMFDGSQIARQARFDGLSGQTTQDQSRRFRVVQR